LTEVHFSNDGWRTSQEATFVDGTCTASALSQIRWTCDLTLADVTVGLDGLNGFSTQIRIDHGMKGEPLLPMGVYKVSTTSWSDAGATVKVKGLSHETYLQAARFITARTLRPAAASARTAALIQEVIPGAIVAWEVDDVYLPGTTVARDRWAFIDGNSSSPSIARSLGARIYAGPNGNWIASPVPTLSDEPVWEASSADVLLDFSEELTDEFVYNIVVADGQSTDTDTLPFPSGIAMDLDPTSPTYVNKPVTQGGFGQKPRFYKSELLRTQQQAQRAAEGMLAPLLGLRQSISFSQAHNPALEPGDVGTIHTSAGDRRVLLDELTYSLTGAPLTGQTRTTATTLVGNAYVPAEDPEGVE